MLRKSILIFLIIYLAAPLSSTPLASELQEILMQQEIAWNEAEKALDDLTIALELSETAHRKSKEELRALRAELQNLKLEIVRLKRASAESEMQKAEVARQFNLAVKRIDDLKSSFDDYQRKAERLERQKKVWKALALIEAVAIAVGAVIIVTVAK